MNITLFFANTDEFENRFFVDNYDFAKSKTSMGELNLKLNSQKESILAWAIFKKGCELLGLKNETKKEKNGKPVFESNNCSFSISHTKGFCLVAFCDGRAIGVDTEQIDFQKNHRSIYKRVLSENERNVLESLFEKDEIRAFFRLWVLKESTLKFSGEGLSGGMNNFDFSKTYAKDFFSENGNNYNVMTIKNNLVSICSEKSDADNIIIRHIFKGETNGRS